MWIASTPGPPAQIPASGTTALGFHEKAKNYKPPWWPRFGFLGRQMGARPVPELRLRDDQLFLQLEDTRWLPYALFVSHSWLGAC